MRAILLEPLDFGLYFHFTEAEVIEAVIEAGEHPTYGYAVHEFTSERFPGVIFYARPSQLAFIPN